MWLIVLYWPPENGNFNAPCVPKFWIWISYLTFGYLTCSDRWKTNITLHPMYNVRGLIVDWVKMLEIKVQSRLPTQNFQSSFLLPGDRGFGLQYYIALVGLEPQTESWICAREQGTVAIGLMCSLQKKWIEDGENGRLTTMRAWL